MLLSGAYTQKLEDVAEGGRHADVGEGVEGVTVNMKERK